MDGDAYTTDMIEGYGDDMSYAVYRLASRNETRGNFKATDEELLQELIDELKRKFEKDVKTKAELTKDEDYRIAYPLYALKIKEKAEKFKCVNSGFRKLACMPTFMLGMVMASRVRRHYVHAPWFKASSLVKMVDVHGAVSVDSFIRYLNCAHADIYGTYVHSSCLSSW